MTQCLTWLGNHAEWYWFPSIYAILVTLAAIGWMIQDEVRFRRHRREVLTRLDQIRGKLDC